MVYEVKITNNNNRSSKMDVGHEQFKGNDIYILIYFRPLKERPVPTLA